MLRLYRVLVVMVVTFVIMVVSTSGFLSSDLLADFVHVQSLDLCNQVLKSVLGEGARLGEDADLIAEGDECRDRLDAEVLGNCLLGLGVDLCKSDVRMCFRDLFVRRSE